MLEKKYHRAILRHWIFLEFKCILAHTYNIIVWSKVMLSLVQGGQGKCCVFCNKNVTPLYFNAKITGPLLPEPCPRIVNTSGYIAFLFHFVVKEGARSVIIFTHYLNALQVTRVA